MSGILKFANSEGAFVRQDSSFRDVVKKGTRFEPEADRYVLYVSYACPWAHRTMITRNLKNLQNVIQISIVDYLMEENGWKFSTAEETPGCIPDPCFNCGYLRELYFKADPNYSARFTVPVLWDKKLSTIVNNESGDIMRILNEAFNDLAGNPALDLYPKIYRPAIDKVNAWIYDDLNNGVYKAGFATSQEEYEKNAKIVAEALQGVDWVLEDQPFIACDRFTEADIRLFTTLIRFDPVYYVHFKCNLKSIRDYPWIMAWMRKIYALPTIKETINMHHIKCHYYMSHKHINPSQIVPLSDGPNLE